MERGTHARQDISYSRIRAHCILFYDSESWRMLSDCRICVNQQTLLEKIQSLLDCYWPKSKRSIRSLRVFHWTPPEGSATDLDILEFYTLRSGLYIFIGLPGECLGHLLEVTWIQSRKFTRMLREISLWNNQFTELITLDNQRAGA